MRAAVLAFAFLQQQDTTVCDLLKKPASRRGVLVRVRAEVLLALPHGMLLIDKSCANAAIRLGFDLPDADATAKGLLPSVEEDCSSGPKRYQFPGVFVGKLAFDEQGRVELRLLSVPELRTTPSPKPGVPWTVVW